ncbi:MAG: hypothetical protein MK085_05055 [Phycisphaerales bacterium]|nr:hypothetical protein [Phycisphaerales bacterium]
MKILLKIVIALVVLLVIGVVVLFFSANAIAKYAIDHAGTSTLGVSTSVDHVGIGLLSGKSTIGGLEVANPAGYEKKDFLTLESGELDASLGGLLGSEVDIDRIVLSGIRLDIEQNAQGFNYQVILDHASGGGDDAAKNTESAPAGSDDGGKRFHIGEILIEDVVITANLLSGLRKDTETTIPIKQLQLKDIGSGKGIPLSKITVLVVEAILQATASAGVDILPSSVLSSLQSVIGNSSGVSLSGLSIDTGKGLKGIGGNIKNVIDQVRSGQPDKIGESIGNVLNNVLGGDNEKKSP